MIKTKENDMTAMAPSAYLAALPTDDLELDLAEARSDYQFYTHVFPDMSQAHRAAYLARDIEAELERRLKEGTLRG